jgi:hypothetical protein
MAFLDNSGDIILDAVLTDTGRMRLARGDGSFNIVKFALGDDEIDYTLYDRNHASGSAYYDIEIMQTPVFEAFTNNGSLMKSKLLSVARTNILYLPVLEVATQDTAGTDFSNYQFSGSYIVAVDANTVGPDTTNALKANTFFNGFNLRVPQNPIATDQGIDNTAIPSSQRLDADLIETQYMLEIDNRFGSITSAAGTTAPVSFIDDDQIATYYLTGPDYISDISSDTDILSPIAGARGNRLKFKIAASLELATSNYLFTRLGSTYTAEGENAATVSNVKFIDSSVRVTGLTTGYRITIPIRFAKSPS